MAIKLKKKMMISDPGILLPEWRSIGRVRGLCQGGFVRIHGDASG